MTEGPVSRTAPALGLVGVPTSAGSHNAGQDQAPAAWRSVDLPDRLRAAGRTVVDHGDLPVHRHRPAPRVGGVRDLERVVGVGRAVADQVETVVAADEVPLVLGGDCTITLGVVAGLARSGDVGLLYLDGDVDLNTPALSGSGVLDTMGMTHLLGGGARALSHLDRRAPLLADDHVELFGFDPEELDTQQWTALTTRRLAATPATAVRNDPAGTADRAWRRLATRTDRIVLHLDVDVLDTGAFPLANFPHFNGLTLDELAACLGVFAARPELVAVVVTEVNPDHDPEGELLQRLRDVLVAALGGAGTRHP